ncbi:MAG: DUF5312 domain-containing protein, partial [Spirochaetales bacterium]|nr:DUF5312 domain-containing protein [Spirochaetales bacterium]
MIEKTIFEKLSGELDDQDREALYQNLRRGVVASEAETREDTGRDKAGPGGDSGESKMVQKALARESFFARAWIWLLARLTVQKEESIFITQKLKQLRRDISQKAPGITVFEMRQLTPAFAKEVFSLFRFCAMVKPYFDYIWLGPGKFEELVVYLLTQKISLKKEKLDDFLSMEDLVAIFSRGGQKDTLKKELLSRLTGYVESIPDADVAEAEAALEPFYYLREAVQFPFAGFFQFFGYDCRNQAIGEEPGFQNASVMLLLRFVEKLCIAGEMNEFLTPPLEPNEGFLRCLIKRQGSSPVQAAGEEENIKNEEEFKALRENLQELNRRIAKFYKKLPLLDILRFYKREPFFVVTRKIPGLHFRDFYFMNLKNSLVKEVETRFTEIRIEYLQHELDKFFAQTDKYALEYYRNYSSIDYEKTGAPFFKYIQSINLLYNYIRNFL